MNRREAAVISAYTGFLVGPFEAMHAYIEEILQRPVWTHELADPELVKKIKELAKPDLIAIAQAADELPTEEWERTKKYTDEQYDAAADKVIANLPDNAVVVEVPRVKV